MRKLLFIVLFMVVTFGAFANMPTRQQAYKLSEPAIADWHDEFKAQYQSSIFHEVFSKDSDFFCPLPEYPEVSGKVRLDLAEARDGAFAAAEYIKQLTGSLASPRGPPVLVAGPPISQRIAAPKPVAASGTTLFLDETGLGSSAIAPAITRRLTTSYTGSLIRVRRSSDSTEQDIGYNGSNELDTTSLATFGAGTDCFVVTIYDQSGNARNLTQSTAANQPQIVSSGVVFTGANGKPECRFDGVNDYFQLAFTLAQPETLFCVFKQITWTSGDAIFDGVNAQAMLLLQTGSSPQLVTYAGSSSTPISFTLGTPALASCVYNGASSTFRKNADAEGTSSIGTLSANGLTLGARGGLGFLGNFGFQELAIYPTAKNSTDQTTARANINAFYALW